MVGVPSALFSTNQPREYSFKSRYNHPSAPCTVSVVCKECLEQVPSNPLHLIYGSKCTNPGSCCHSDNIIESSSAAAITSEVPLYIVVMCKAPDRAVTSGQVLALYDGDVCIGGGPISFGGRFLQASDSLVAES